MSIPMSKTNVLYKDILIFQQVLGHSNVNNRSFSIVFGVFWDTLYRVSKKKLMPFQIQISREFHYGTLSIPIAGIQRTGRD